MPRSIGTLATIAIATLAAIADVGCRSRGSTPAPAPATVNEVGKEFHTADHAIERATVDPLYPPRGGYVVTDWADDPHRIHPKVVWLVQQELFESTYELAP